MEWLSSLMSGGVEGFGKGISTMAQGIRAAIVGPEMTAEQKTQIDMQLLMMDQAAQKMTADYEALIAKGQIDLSTLDAQSGDRFRSWPRPAAIWMCVLGLFYSFIIQPIVPWTLEVLANILTLFGYQLIKIPPLPQLSGEVLLGLGGSLLGLGGLRTLDKIKGKA